MCLEINLLKWVMAALNSNNISQIMLFPQYFWARSPGEYKTFLSKTLNNTELKYLRTFFFKQPDHFFFQILTEF